MKKTIIKFKNKSKIIINDIKETRRSKKQEDLAHELLQQILDKTKKNYL